MAKGTVISYREQPYTADDWYISITPTGCRTVRWEHNNRAIETFCGYDAEKRAKNFIKFLIKQFNNEREKFLKHKGGLIR